MKVAETIRKRVEEADRIVSEEKLVWQHRISCLEADAAKWRAIYEQVLALEASEAEAEVDVIFDVRDLAISDVKNKSDVVRAALLSAGGPVKPSQLLKSVQPVVSRSGLYWVLGRMREEGTLVDAGDGRVMLAGSPQQTSTTQ